MLGKWFLLKALIAIAIVLTVGVAAEFAFRSMRLISGPHTYFVVSSQHGYYGSLRGGRAFQRDSIVAGPFKTSVLCNAELRSTWKSGYSTNYYCEDLLLSDARAMRPQIIIPQRVP